MNLKLKSHPPSGRAGGGLARRNRTLAAVGLALSATLLAVSGVAIVTSPITTVSPAH